MSGLGSLKAAGFVAYVRDIEVSKAFYIALGFEVTRDEAGHLSVGVGDFWMDFHPQDKEDKPRS